MKFTTRNLARLSVLFGLSLIASGAFAQGIFQETDALMAEAKAAHADVLAPNSYAAAQKSYAQAQKDASTGREDKAQKALNSANQSLSKAIEASKLGAVTFTNELAARDRAITANAEKFEPDMWASAEKQFADAAKKLEGGNVNSAQKAGATAMSSFDAAELAAIKTAIVGNARQLIADADKAKVEKSAPKTLQSAKDLVSQAESNLDADRYATAGPGMAAAEAEYQAKPCRTLLSSSCFLNCMNLGRNLSQSIICASSSGPSIQACLRTILPSMVTGTIQAPHIPVASTIIELRLATVFTP
jgi:hypothetical protein